MTCDCDTCIQHHLDTKETDMVTKTSKLELDLDLAITVRQYHNAHIDRCNQIIAEQIALRTHYEHSLDNLKVEIATLEQQIIDLTPEH